MSQDFSESNYNLQDQVERQLERYQSFEPFREGLNQLILHNNVVHTDGIKPFR